MSTILLTTLNARFSHASLGLRYLLANMGALRGQTQLLEFTIKQRPIDIVEQLLAARPRIIGLGVYIWNARECAEVVALLKCLRPEVTVVLGGPEVSHESERQAICQQADYVIAGQADVAFAALCQQLLAGTPPATRLIAAPPVALEQLTLPYAEYRDEDLAHRVIYVEASRGCPFKCEFCLSALDKTASPFPLAPFLEELATLYRRGLRHFKFVDRTFNLKVDSSLQILEFFLARLDVPHDEPSHEPLFLHFELIPDHLPPRLRAAIQRFPPGTLQFEIGVQSLNQEVQQRISRKQDNAKTAQNLRWLRDESHAHLHADLIIGLPGEGVESFAAGFDQLWQMGPHEIQVGILKRLRGSPIIRHSAAFDLRFNPQPPYNLLSTNTIDFATMQRLSRFARYWELVANSGRFHATLPLLLGESPFARFMSLSDWLYATTGQSDSIQLPRLFELVYRGACEALQLEATTLQQTLLTDFLRVGLKGVPRFLRDAPEPASRAPSQRTRRQQRHQ
ncbi:MAG: B12-binding domain-containing radical SAM protein [Gammaproteobacteria bacterium]|nr:B12-binding domain-containing radical SAM protein [Gammaproteobacteria bacterium]